MPEGPTVRRFCSLVSPFVGQFVVKVGGSTRQIALQDLQGQHFLNCQVNIILHFDSKGFLVFYNCRMAWCSSPFSEPGCDILSPEFNKERALQSLAFPRPVCITLMDQKCFSGVGNIIKNEILYLAQIHPLSLGSVLPLDKLCILLDHAVSFTSDWLKSKMQRKGLHYHIYMKEYCPKGHQVTKESLGPTYGLKRLTWYCPECQPQVKSDQ
ncbi:endonuclease 8-like 2 [Bombina bombina]|uniref:endonuclease 8-like 2 n=1 Tax=Bombina bombina TaxID=8345 RepID=UPI00235AFD9D|nr:endonuclease 8-like 2 [Bombina bombina]